jgi:hypothetical protein
VTHPTIDTFPGCCPFPAKRSELDTPIASIPSMIFLLRLGFEVGAAMEALFKMCWIMTMLIN